MIKCEHLGARVAAIAGVRPPEKSVDDFSPTSVHERPNTSENRGVPESKTIQQLAEPLIDWRRVLTVVKPETLIRWHRMGFRLFWQWKSRPRGRPRVPADLQHLIVEMAAANRT